MEQKNNKQNSKENKVIKDSFLSKINIFFHKLSNKISPIRQILIWYLAISMIGAILLYIPLSHNHGESIKFIDALFVSSSAFSDTGLTTLSLAQKFNWFGKVIVFILINIGGVGWFTIKIFIITFILKKSTSHADLTYGATEVGTIKKTETLGLVFSAITISFFSTIIFGLIFGIMFATQTPNDVLKTVTDNMHPNLKGHWGASILTGFFHATASINNSGLDIFTGSSSLGPYSGNYTIQVFTMFLFILGGIGFGVFYDIYMFFKFKITGRSFTFSLITKLSVTAYVIIALAGLGLVYTSEEIMLVNKSASPFLSNKFDGSMGAKFWALTFNTFSTRNAGFSTMNIDHLGWSTKMIYSLMMFIGSGPGSTAGGLRTTTIAVLLMGLWSHLRRRPTTTAFKRTIPHYILTNASVIFLSSLILTFTSVLLISIAEPELTSKSLINIICVVFSAFGTTGLSPITNDKLEQWGIFSKLIIVIIMFIGQMGMATTISQFKSKNINSSKNYVKEKVNLG